ncbi:MAG: helix-turn-helix domain-containing protein [Methylococcaceae bacterium]
MSARGNHQQHILLAELRQRPVSTLEARNELFIMSPAARVMELKEQGHNIITHLVHAGTKKIAQYVLLSAEVVL